MRGKLWLLALVLALLPGCGERAGLESLPAGEETSTPVETGSPFGALPVTEEGIWNYYLHEMNGYYMIRDITAYEGDYLVELGEGNEGSTMLEWIFGDTGRKVQMTTMGNRREVEIQGRGVLHIRTGGEDTDGEWTVIPRSYTAIAPAEGGYAVEVEETVWMAPGRDIQSGMSSFAMPGWTRRGYPFPLFPTQTVWRPSRASFRPVPAPPVLRPPWRKRQGYLPCGYTTQD